MRIHALPGGLDDVPVFNSNSPELIQQAGITLSGLPPSSPDATGVFMDHAFEGRFSVFSHHLADVSAGSTQVLHLALVAHNHTARTVTVRQQRGASRLTRPEAPFKALESLLDDPTGTIYAGPGDRVASELLHDLASQDSRTVGPGASTLIATWALSPDVAAGRNERSTLLHLESDGPVYLTEVALLAPPNQVPDLGMVQAAIDTKLLAGPRDPAPTAYDPDRPPTGGSFRYGRVGGISQGDRWTGTLFGPGGPALPAPGERVGFPIASVILNHLGTGQVQSAPMRKRYPDTAYQAHGNYGVTYDLTLPLDNPDDAVRTFTLGLSSPLKLQEGATLSFASPAGRRIHFRGQVRLTWQDEKGVAQTRYRHLVLHDGEDLPPFETITVPGRSRLEAHLTLIYPADCTPPQMLTVGRS
ncbi:MAG TPA: DUF3370 family protein [Pantanalinema sp.]